MKLVIFGSTGGTGQALLRQAVADGHQVVAVARRPEVITQESPLLQVLRADALVPETLAPVLRGAEAVISALGVLPGFVATQGFGRLAALSSAALLTQVAVQGLLSGVLAVIAYGKAVEHLGAGRAALFPALVPAAALILGVPVTGEFPAPVEWLGAALATAGLAVAMGAVRLRRG